MNMKTLIAAAALIAIPTNALPQAFYSLMALNDAGQEIFAMSDGACLRGPLYIKNENGKKIFELAAGVLYPVGCMEARP